MSECVVSRQAFQGKRAICSARWSDSFLGSVSAAPF